MFYKKIKRIFDVITALLLIIFLSPLLLLVSLSIWLYDRGEVFVKEPLRLGIKGKEFKMYKFRSMIPNAHAIIKNSDDYQRWIKADGKLKISQDPRITPVGKLIRKTDIDELPQLFNVLVGQMSIVGPRPMYLEEMDRYLKKYPQGKKYVKRILKVKPGMTGVWQVSGRNSIKFRDRMILEAKYASHVNFKDDIKFLVETPVAVLTRKGVYE